MNAGIANGVFTFREQKDTMINLYYFVFGASAIRPILYEDLGLKVWYGITFSQQSCRFQDVFVFQFSKRITAQINRLDHTLCERVCALKVIVQPKCKRA